MQKENIWNNQNLINILKENGVVVMPTDTIYGIVGKALNKDIVLRIYDIKKRAPEKPCIILIGDVAELEKFSIILSEEQKNRLEECWPISAMADIGQQEAISIILDCPNEKFSYLHRNTKTLAFRLPASKVLRELLLETGPLIAPSANPEGLPPSRNIAEAKEYFGNFIDLYVDGGKVNNKASKLIKLDQDGSVTVLRE
ncbi:MAG: L-threonylcarbamoyladenylate synthase [Candidatus Paceibacterota bacterium]